MKGMIYLSIAVIFEVIGTTGLKASNGFSNLWPSVVLVVSYGISFYLLSLSFMTIPLGIGYAIWSGIGTILTVLIGIVVWKEVLTLSSVLGILLIISGVIILNLKGAAA